MISHLSKTVVSHRHRLVLLMSAFLHSLHACNLRLTVRGDDRLLPHQSQQVRHVCQSLSDDGCVSEDGRKRKRRACALYLSCDRARSYGPQSYERACGSRQTGWEQHILLHIFSYFCLWRSHSNRSAAWTAWVWLPPSSPSSRSPLSLTSLRPKTDIVLVISMKTVTALLTPTPNPGTRSAGWSACSLAWPWQDLCSSSVR